MTMRLTLGIPGRIVAPVLLAFTFLLLAGPVAATGAPPTRSEVRPAAAKPVAHRLPATASRTPRSQPDAQAAAPDTASKSEVLRGDAEGTVFRSLTVEGEDRVHVEVERPALDLDLDPSTAPGLAPGSARDVLERESPDLVKPWLGMLARKSDEHLGRPWLGAFATGPVARFRPELQDVDRWTLTVANSLGQSVVRFTGRGNPPHEIAWDGRTTSGGLVVPGLTYSYVMEAFDRAGNRRNFVGESFQVPAVRFDTPAGPVLTFAARGIGSEIDSPGSSAGSSSPLLLEAASWINQIERLDRPVRVIATARSADQAARLAAAVVRGLSPHLLGGAGRLQATPRTLADAPEGGVVTLVPADAPGSF
jgi:hypothetical protein